MPTRRVGLTSCCVVLRPHGCCGRRVRCSADRAAWCAGGRRSFCFLLVAPTDLRPPRGGLQSVGVPVCCPARPRRPRGALHIGAACRCVLSGQALQASRCPPHRRGLSLCVARPVPPPPTGTAAGLADLLLVAPLVFRAPDGPAAREARRPHFVRRRASKPGQAPQASRRPPIGRGACVLSGQAPPTPVDTAGRPSPSRRTRIQWSLPTFLSPPPISHAIPLRLFQTMNLQRWNCNVFRLY